MIKKVSFSLLILIVFAVSSSVSGSDVPCTKRGKGVVNDGLVFDGYLYVIIIIIMIDYRLLVDQQL